MADQPLLDDLAPTGGKMKPKDVIRKISDGITNVIHGEGRPMILQELEKDPTPKTAAMLIYKPVSQGIEQAEARGVDADADFIFGVATDGIDQMLEILQAMGKVGEDEQSEEMFREQALMNLVAIHGEQVEDDPQVKADAELRLAEMAEDGTLAQGIQSWDKKARERGVDPNEYLQEGVAMIQPQRKPLAAGIERGLNDGQV